MNHKLVPWCLVVALILFTLLPACSHDRQVARQDTRLYLKNLAANKSVADEYRSRCEAGCRAKVMMCTEQTVGRPTGADASWVPGREAGSCGSRCFDALIQTQCAPDDTACQETRTTEYFRCSDRCTGHDFRTQCPSEYRSCMAGCAEVPECFMENDCAPDAICAGHKCIRAPACVDAASCPRDDTYICYKGHCVAY